MSYYYDELKKTLERNLSWHETCLDLWKNVKRLSKKDGTDFANFGKNFENAEVNNEFDRLEVSGRSKFEWIRDSIDFLLTADDNTPEDRIILSYRTRYYHLTVDEVFTAIENRIRYYEVEIENDKIQLAHAESICNLTENTINALYKQALKELEDAGFTPTSSFDTPSILYEVRKIVERIYAPSIVTKEADLKVKWKC
jgi:hypothetical protein